MWFSKNKDKAKDSFPKFQARSLEDMHAYRVFDDARQVIEDGDMRLATVQDYADWLQAHIKAGGHVTEAYDYNLRDTLVVGRDTVIPPLCGARSLKIIVPADVTLNIQPGNSHNDFYFYDTSLHGAGYVPVYNDVREELLKRGMTSTEIDPKTKPKSNTGIGFLPGTAAEKAKAAAGQAAKQPTAEETTAAVVDSIQRGLEKDVTVKPIRLRMKPKNHTA